MDSLITFVDNIHNAGKKEIIDFLQTNFPKIPISIGMNKTQLTDAVIKNTYPRQITESSSVLEIEMCDYVKLPFLKKDEIEFLESDWVRPDTNIIFNQFPVEIEEKSQGPKRWQSKAIEIGKRKEDQVMYDIKKRVENLAKKFNPLFKLDEMRYMKSDPFLKRQMPHADNTEVDTGKANVDQTHTLVLSSIIAFSDNTSFYITVENKLKKVMIDKGEILVFKSESTHCGGDNPFADINERFHCNFHDCSRPLKPNQIIHTFQCPFCERFVDTKEQLKSHKMECEMNTGSAAAMKRVAKRKSRSKRSPPTSNKKTLKVSGACSDVNNAGESANDNVTKFKMDNEIDEKMMVASVATMNEERVIQRISNEIQNQSMTQSGASPEE